MSCAIGWCRQHEARISTSFTVIDRKMKDSDFTLRDMIMSLPATTGNTKTSLFQSIDKATKGAGFTLSFHPDKAAEAVMGIRGLYPHLLAKYGKGINSFFTADAIDAGIRMEWDPKTKKVSSEDDKELACIVGMDNDVNIAPLTVSSTLEEELPIRLTTYQPERGEEDSVSTIGTKRSANDSAQPFKKARTHEVRTEVLTNHDLASDISSLTTGTMKTRMSTMETQITQVNTQMTQLGQLMRQILDQGQRMQVPSSLLTNTSPTTDSTRRSNQPGTTPESNRERSDNSRRNPSGDTETPLGGSAPG
jgi:hypothetical protein